ncbi:Hypothetical protein A7982_09901 [Minicystis rosea]|nr:Hypothetical protein A7982_09901 [Minicystis rosea]
MSISLSLVISPRARPRPGPGTRDPADRVVAWADGFVPVAWWALFVPEDAVRGKGGLALSTRTEDALDRLRRRAPEIRAFAGRHALRLRALEAALAAAPSLYVHAELQELYHKALSETELASLWGELERGSFFDRGRLLASKQHGGTHADAVVGVVPREPEVALPEPETLDARSLAALREGDASELDVLEEALARTLVDEHAPWMPICRRRWGDGRADTAAQEVVAALLEGRPNPFAPLAPVRDCFAAFALHEAARRAVLTPKRGALRQALKGATAPLAAPAALAFRVRCPSLDALYVAEWLDGGPPPRTVDAPAAVLACRLNAIGAPAWPLSVHDPLAVPERALAGEGGHAEPDIEAADLALSRALRLTAKTARGFLPEADGNDSDALANGAFRTAAASCKHAARLDGPTRAALLSIPAPEAPFLSGSARACIRLALGDLTVLPDLLSGGPAPLVPALRAAGAAEHALPWLVAQAGDGDLSAAALLLDTPAADDAARTVAQSVEPAAQQRLTQVREQFYEGLVSLSEHDAAIAEIADLARALGPRGASLREAIHATEG